MFTALERPLVTICSSIAAHFLRLFFYKRLSDDQLMSSRCSMCMYCNRLGKVLTVKSYIILS